MDEHPLFRMWKDQLEEEMAQKQAWATRRASREAELVSWNEAWRTYKDRLKERRNTPVFHRWWNLAGWFRWLFRLHAPGGGN